jgi:hypothetical protein
VVSKTMTRSRSERGGAMSDTSDPGTVAVMGKVSSRKLLGSGEGKAPERPAAKTRSLQGRPGAAKPQREKKQAVEPHTHGVACTGIGFGPQQTCVQPVH